MKINTLEGRSYLLHPKDDFSRRTHFGADSIHGSPCLAFSGMFNTGDQEWQPLKEKLSEAGYQLHYRELPGHGRNGQSLNQVHFSDCVDHAVKEIMEMSDTTGCKIPVFGHSFGAAVAIAAAHKCEGYVESVTAISTAPHRFVPKLVKKYLHWRYIIALRGTPFALRPEEEEFLADGCDIAFGPESGHILREAAGGIKIPRISDLKCRSIMVAAKDDQLIPLNVTIENMAYHASGNLMSAATLISPNGGHFCHYNPVSRDFVSNGILQVFQFWKMKDAK